MSRMIRYGVVLWQRLCWRKERNTGRGRARQTVDYKRVQESQSCCSHSWAFVNAPPPKIAVARAHVSNCV